MSSKTDCGTPKMRPRLDGGIAIECAGNEQRAVTTKATCATCGAEDQPGAFCSMCGSRLEQDNDGPSKVDGPSRRPAWTRSPPEFSLSPGLAAGHSLKGIVIALVLVVLLIFIFTGNGLIALICLLAAALAAVALTHHRRTSSSWTRRDAGRDRRHRTTDELRDRARFTLEAARVWSTTRREVSLRHHQIRAMRSERHQRIYATGEAVVAGDTDAVAARRLEVDAIDQEIVAREDEIKHILKNAQQRIERDRDAIHPTVVKAQTPIPAPAEAPSVPDTPDSSER